MIFYNYKDIGYEGQYSISYDDLREHYNRVCSYSNKEFCNNLPEIAHLATVICWFKEIPSYICLCDEGIVHQLIHLIHLGKEWGTIHQLRKIRNQFKKELKLA